MTMFTAEEWDRTFDRLMPVVTLGMGTISLIMGVASFLHAGSLGRRVYRSGDDYLVSVRYPGQWQDLREFVQPGDPEVAAIYSRIGPDARACLDYVCRNISYRRDIGEFFQYPAETLARGLGDCDDSANLTESLLRNFSNAYAVLGTYAGCGHAWGYLDGEILETTYTSARPVPDPENYRPYVYYNDLEVIELWPGALAEVFGLGRDETAKFRKMAGTSRA